jgi:hypothetical protein
VSDAKKPKEVMVQTKGSQKLNNGVPFWWRGKGEGKILVFLCCREL